MAIVLIFLSRFLVLLAALLGAPDACLEGDSQLEIHFARIKANLMIYSGFRNVCDGGHVKCGCGLK
jgi:hypothetical protein